MVKQLIFYLMLLKISCLTIVKKLYSSNIYREYLGPLKTLRKSSFYNSHYCYYAAEGIFSKKLENRIICEVKGINIAIYDDYKTGVIKKL